MSERFHWNMKETEMLGDRADEFDGLHPSDCDCEACAMARKEEAYQRAVEWNALFADLKRKRRLRNQGPSWKTALAGTALITALVLPSSASAREDAAQGFLNPPAGYTLYLAWEDHSSLAWSDTDGWLAFDPDSTGNGRGWHLSASDFTTAR